jgi:hypothetical protein
LPNIEHQNLIDKFCLRVELDIELDRFKWNANFLDKAKALQDKLNQGDNRNRDNLSLKYYTLKMCELLELFEHYNVHTSEKDVWYLKIFLSRVLDEHIGFRNPRASSVYRYRETWDEYKTYGWNALEGYIIHLFRYMMNHCDIAVDKSSYSPFLAYCIERADF